MSDELHDRVTNLETTVTQHSDLLRRLENRQQRLETVIREWREETRSQIEGVSRDVQGLGSEIHDATIQGLKTWPEDAVQALESERSARSSGSHLMVGLLGAAAAVIAGLLAIVFWVHP